MISGASCKKDPSRVSLPPRRVCLASWFAILLLHCTVNVEGRSRRSLAYLPWVSSRKQGRQNSLFCRGGATTTIKTEREDVFAPLAEALLPLLKTDDATLTIHDVVQALKSLAGSQQTFKGLDGMAHEAYQRTHTSEDISLHVSGRALRTVARTQAVALGLGACELCELVQSPHSFMPQLENGTLADKQVLYNNTLTVKYQKQSLNMTALVLYQPDYRGGAGVEHGSVFGEIPTRTVSGRIFIVLGSADASMSHMIHILGLPSKLVALQTSKGSEHEAASVQPLLYRAASHVLEQIGPVLAPYNATAIHVVGHSLAGGAAALMATILEGHLAVYSPKPAPKKTKKKAGSVSKANATVNGKNATTTVLQNTTAALSNETTTTVLSGWGRGRTSCVTLGAPPSCSTNVPTDNGLVISLVYGDDWVSRTTDVSLQRLLSRIRPILKRRKSLTKHVVLLSDTVKLATQGLSAHAHGREGEETRLAGTGSQAYLLRPRRYGNHVSIHETGRASGREAIRAAVLWQLTDILLSPSYAKHHTLDSYIHGLDRVHIRGLEDETGEDVGAEELDDDESSDVLTQEDKDDQAPEPDDEKDEQENVKDEV